MTVIVRYFDEYGTRGAYDVLEKTATHFNIVSVKAREGSLRGTEFVLEPPFITYSRVRSIECLP